MNVDPKLLAKEMGLELRKSIALALASEGSDGVAFLKACDEVDKLRAEGDPPFQACRQITPEVMDIRTFQTETLPRKAAS